MPDSFTDREKVLDTVENEIGITDSDRKERIADLIIEEAQTDEGSPETLLESIKNGAKSILSNLGLETVSWVENPSQDSMFVMMKNESNRIKKTTSIYKNPEKDDWETVYGPVMRPNDIDKDGDIATAKDIKDAAHEFIAEGRVKQFDQDHDLNTGKGTLVESWILKEDKEYELPNGETEVIEKGAWMVGVQPTQEVRERIERGEITGWSIFGQADQIPLKGTKREANFKMEQDRNSFKEDTMPKNNTSDGENPGVELKDVHSELTELRNEFKEYAEMPEPSTVKSVDELNETLQNLEKEDETVLVELSSDLELTEKEPEAENLTELLNHLKEQLSESNFSMLQEAVSREEDGEDDEDDAEKQANMEKGADEEKVRQEQQKVEKQRSGKLRPFANQVEG